MPFWVDVIIAKLVFARHGATTEQSSTESALAEPQREWRW